MKKAIYSRTLVALLVSFAPMAYSQNVGINTTGTAPNTYAILDLNTGNTFTAATGGRGILIPNVSLANTTDESTFGSVAPTTSLLVYNTNAVMTGGWAGFWYWSVTKWVPLLTNAATGGAWSITGNAGLTAGTNFLGTTDGTDVVFKANSTESFRIDNANGYVGFGTTTPGAKVETYAPTGVHALYGHTPNTGAYIAYESAFTFGVTPQTINGAGVWAANPLAGYTSMYAQSSGAATVAAAIDYSSIWIAHYSYVDNASATADPPAIYGQSNVTNSALGGIQSAIEGYFNRSTTASNPGWGTALLGVSNCENENSFGAMGVTYCSTAATNNTDVDGGGYMTAGGYFQSSTYLGVNNAYAYVAANDAGTGKKIIGTNSVSEIVPTPTHGRVTLTCPESPEYWYQDYGTAQMVNGKVHVNLDPILADVIFVNDSNPLRVFCTPVNMPNFNGVTIMNETATGFDIVELNGGNHSGRVDYQLVAKPRTNYGEGRFSQAPGPVGAPKNLPAAQAQNQINPAKIWHWQSDPEVYHYQLPKQQPKGAKASPEQQNVQQ